MIGLDTNVLARFLLQDDPRQSPRAGEIMSSLGVESPGWVGVATILELVWVLSGNSRLDRKSIVKALNRLLLQEEIVIEQADTVENATRLFSNGTADFADCLIACSGKAAGCDRTLTFDRHAARDAGMELIT